MSRLIATGSAAGALAGKVSGAGGGGFMTFLVDPPHRADIIRALSKQTGQVLTCSFTTLGAEKLAGRARRARLALHRLNNAARFGVVELAAT